MSVERTNDADQLAAMQQAEEAAAQQAQQAHQHKTHKHHHVTLFRGTTRFAHAHGVTNPRTLARTNQLQKQLNPSGVHRRVQRSGGEGQHGGQGRGHSQQGGREQGQQQNRGQQQQNREQQNQQNQQNGMLGARGDERGTPLKLRIKPVTESAAARVPVSSELQALAAAQDKSPQILERSLRLAWTQRCLTIVRQYALNPGQAIANDLFAVMQDLHQACLDLQSWPTDAPPGMAGVIQDLDQLGSPPPQAPGVLGENVQTYNLLLGLLIFSGYRSMSGSRRKKAMARVQGQMRIVQAGAKSIVAAKQKQSGDQTSP